MNPDYVNALGQIGRVEALLNQRRGLDPKYQKLVLEVSHLRIHQIVEATIVSVICKLQIGAMYLDATQPKVLIPSRSIESAKDAMSTQRSDGRKNLRWGKTSDIKLNIKFAIDQTDPLFRTLDIHGSTWASMTKVRNHIAHRTKSTRSGFQSVIAARFGVERPRLSPGGLLDSQYQTGPALIDEYAVKSRVFLKEMVRAPH